MRRFLRRLFRLDEPARLRRRIGFVPPGKEPELVPLDEGGDIDMIGGDHLPQDVSGILDDE